MTEQAEDIYEKLFDGCVSFVYNIQQKNNDIKQKNNISDKIERYLLLGLFWLGDF